MSEELNQASLEKRDAERVEARLKVRFKVIAVEKADELMASGGYSDVFSATDLQEVEVKAESQDAFTENVSVSGLRLTGDMRLVGGKALKEGSYLALEFEIADVPVPVKAV